MLTRNETKKETQTFIFREPHNARELEDLLRVRYAAFMQSDWSATVNQNEYRIEIDEYDFFALENGQQRAVGSIRLVREQAGKYAPWLNQILANKPNLHLVKRGKYPFTMFKNFKECLPLLSRFLAKAKTKKDIRISEAGRLAIVPDLNNLRMGTRFIDAMFAICFIESDLNVIQVKTDIMRLYQNYGFQPIKGVQHHTLKIPFQAHYATDKMINPSYVGKIQKMRQAYLETGQICFHTDQPECYYLEKMEAERSTGL
jgi:hypothetical protein